MFDLLGDAARELGKVVGVITGTIIGVPLLAIAEALGITVDMVKEAKKAGCKTYEEIKDFYKL